MSASDPSINLSCVEVEGDRLEIEHTIETNEYWFHMRGNSGSPTVMVLTPKRARELFNWLGVQLHKYGDAA